MKIEFSAHEACRMVFKTSAPLTGPGSGLSVIEIMAMAYVRYNAMGCKCEVKIDANYIGEFEQVEHELNKAIWAKMAMGHAIHVPLGAIVYTKGEVFT